MTFKSKYDTYFSTFILVAILILAGASLFPLFLVEAREDLLVVSIICLSIFVSSVGLILWITLSISYTFKEKHLFVKGGPFRSRIPYEKITRITTTKDIFTGYRLSTSRDGLEIYYTTAAFGSVKISPKCKEQFISELKKHCPNIVMDLS